MIAGGRRSWRVAAAAAALLVLGAPNGYAQNLFDEHTPLALTLTAPFKTIEREKGKDERPYRTAVLTTTDAAGAPVDLSVELRARGNFRRKHCSKPPLRVRFAKKQRDATAFTKQRRLKLVRPCKDAAHYEQLVVEEYLLYRVFEALSDYSFRVRPTQITFVDTDRKAKRKTSFAFFIEDQDKMAKRYGRQVADWPNTPYSRLEPQQASIVELFMFMAGAHDWSIVTGPKGEPCCHNARLLIDGDSLSGVLPVPYDFDFSGIINAPYATPPEQLPIRRVTQRYYRGRCKAPELWAQTFAHFRDRREAMYEVYRSSTQLQGRNRDEALDYLDGFFDILDSAKRVERTIFKRCRQPPA